MEEGSGKNSSDKGKVCVTGGTGFVGSWLVKSLLQHGYSVNTTARLGPEGKRDISYLRNLPGASDRLQIFDADLDRPESFAAAIEGCVGVFHVATPLDLEAEEAEQVKVDRITKGTLGILQACADSKTVRRVVYTSSISAAVFSGGVDIVDESAWTDVELVRKMGLSVEGYVVTKTVTEKLVTDFGEKSGLDIVSVLPSWIHGPFLSPNCPDSVQISMALILGDEKKYKYLVNYNIVHVEDVVKAHIHLFEYSTAKGRYICTTEDLTIYELYNFLSTTYPHLKLPTEDSLKDMKPIAFPGLSSKKLLETGFKFENGLQEMYDGAIKSCKEIGLL